jgi:molybdenum cofactor synthesis domain-containing protein
LKAGILIIGNEVLDGHVMDTNSNWIENRVTAQSAMIHRLVAIRDDMNEIANGLRFLIDTCDVIIASGGLGPTHDDMTLNAVASALGLPLVENQQALAMVERQYRMLHEHGIVGSPEITEPRRKMALLPEGGLPLENRVGGAPGVMIELDNQVIFCLPGVPAELKDIFSSSVEPWLEKNVTVKYVEKIVEFVWKDESEFAPHIDTVMRKHQGVYIKSMPRKYGTTDVLRVWISARGSQEASLNGLVSAAIGSLAREVGKEPKEVGSLHNEGR